MFLPWERQERVTLDESAPQTVLRTQKRWADQDYTSDAHVSHPANPTSNFDLLFGTQPTPTGLQLARAGGSMLYRHIIVLLPGGLPCGLPGVGSGPSAN